MEKIKKVLEDNNLAFNELPENLQERFHALSEMIQVYNQAIAVFNENDYHDEEESKKLDAKDAELNELEAELTKDIEDAIVEIKNQQAAEAAAAKEAEDAADAAAAEAEKHQTAAATDSAKEEDGGGFWGVLGFVGIVVLAALGIKAAQKK